MADASSSARAAPRALAIPGGAEAAGQAGQVAAPAPRTALLTAVQPHGTESGQAALAMSTPLQHEGASLHPSPSQHTQGGGFAFALSPPLQVAAPAARLTAMQPHGTEPGQAALALSTPLQHQVAALHPSPSQHAEGGGFALALSLPVQTHGRRFPPPS